MTRQGSRLIVVLAWVLSGAVVSFSNMAQVQPPQPKQQQEECPPPPIEHLAAEGQHRQEDEYLYDKKRGNPGPRAKIYEVVSQRTPSTDENDGDVSVGDAGPPAVEVPMSDEEEMMQNAMEGLGSTMLFPEVSESWLRKCVELRMVQDKWDLDRTAAYIFENENIAPRKAAKIRVTGNENLDAHKENLFAYTHDIDEDYKFFAQVKLTEMFPNLSMASIRRIFADFRSHYMPTAITLAEGLEDYFERESKSWDDLQPLTWMWVTVKREGKLWRYPLQVVKGMKCWSKKKGRTMGFPRIPSEELKMADGFLAKLRQKRLEKKKKRLADEEYQRLVAEAKARGETDECPVCDSDYRKKEDVVKCTQGHAFCARCLKNVCWELVAGQVKLSLNGEIDCFTTGCEGKFLYSTLERTLEPTHMSRVEELHIANVINAANLDNVIRCNYCSYTAIVDVPPEVNKVFSCENPKCLRQVCRLCGDPWKGHEGQVCKPKELTDESLSRMKFEEALTAILTRTCAKCKAIIVKHGGCNKVTCRCGATLCYNCRTPYIGYDHFCKHLRTGDQSKCDQCTSCMLYEDSTKKDAEAMQKMRTKYELDRLAKLEDEAARNPSAKAPTAPAATPGQAPAAPAQAPAPAQAAFQRQFG